MKKIVVAIVIVIVLVFCIIYVRSNKYILCKTYNELDSYIEIINKYYTRNKDNVLIKGMLHVEHTSNMKHSLNVVTSKDYELSILKKDNNLSIYVNDMISKIELPSIIDILDKINLTNIKYLSNSNNKIKYTFSDNIHYNIYTKGILKKVVKYELIYNNERLIFDNNKISYESDNLNIRIYDINNNSFSVSINDNLNCSIVIDDHIKISSLYNGVPFNISIGNDIVFSLSKKDGKFSNFKAIITKDNVNIPSSAKTTEISTILELIMDNDIYSLFK